MSTWAERRTGQRRGFRRGDVFGVRLTAEERAELEALRDATAGPEGLGPWLVWAARRAAITRVLPAPAPAGYYPLERVVPGPGTTGPVPVVPELYPDVERRVILDLCAGSGAWSEPYRAAGYAVVRVTLPDSDVRTYTPPAGVWGVLAAPPCDQFSLARNGHERDFATALEVVCACMRVIGFARPQWWALENPVGLLSRWLGTPRDVWQPHEFGDPWTKRTAIWGRFTVPARGPFVMPTGSAMDRPTADACAVTPPGFARAFFEANP